MRKKKLAILLLGFIAAAGCAIGLAACGGNDGTLEPTEATEGLVYKTYSTYAVVTGIGTATDTDIVIATEYEGLPVTTIGYNAFIGCASITSVTIGNGVTSIGDYAFENCTSLESITIPDGVTSIGEYAFWNCTSLTSITIPDSVTSIGISAFRCCSSLTSITIPDSVTSIGNWTFVGCFSLKSISIPNTVTSIGKGAFSGCSFESITIPNGVTTIEQQTFEYCTSLTSITIPDGVTAIGDLAFKDCTALTEINFNATECADLINKGSDIFYNAGQSGDGITVKIGANVKKIPAYLFSVSDWNYYPNIVNVIFAEESVCEGIGNGAFGNCSLLTSITIPDTVTYIGDSAFNLCVSFTNITIGNNVESIGKGAFAYCTSLNTVYYNGTAEEWNNISIDSSNTYLTDATRYYYSESEPEEEGNYWHYVDGEIVIWTKE